MLWSDLCAPASVLPVQLGCFYVAQTVWVGAGEQQDVSLGKENKRLKSSHPSGAALKEESIQLTILLNEWQQPPL